MQALFYVSSYIPVGASLLAKAMCQPTEMLNVTTSSRAGSLPHGICVVSSSLLKLLPILVR